MPNPSFETFLTSHSLNSLWQKRCWNWKNICLKSTYPKWSKNWYCQKMSLTKNVFLNWYSPMKKSEKDSNDFWHRKLTLNVKFWHFLTHPNHTILKVQWSSLGVLIFRQNYFKSSMNLQNRYSHNPKQAICLNLFHHEFFVK